MTLRLSQPRGMLARVQLSDGGNRLRELRLAHGLTLAAVGAVALTDKSTIYRWENGMRPIPDTAKLRLAELFGVTRAYLMGWDDDATVAA